MGFFKRLFSEKEIVVDPADLTLPDVIPTDYPEVILKKAAGEQRVDINVVGESMVSRLGIDSSTVCKSHTWRCAR